jgi:hypothetical protein
MANTTNFGWETPDDTDLVKDGAAAIRTLGSSVDTTTKNLNPETTLGDISYRSSTANVNTRLAIGSNGSVLTVASGVPVYAAGVSIAFNAQTAAYTLVAADAFKLVTVNDTVSRTITIPPSVFTAGQIINVQRIGTGAVPFAAGSGVTITSTGASSAAPTLRARYSAATIVCTATDVFTVLGDIS